MRVIDEHVGEMTEDQKWRGDVPSLVPVRQTSENEERRMRLWIPPLSGAAVAGLIVVIAGVVSFRSISNRERDDRSLQTDDNGNKASLRHWLAGEVQAGPAWTISDSWVTNIAAAGAVLGAVVNALSGLGTLISTSDSVGVIILFVIFGGAAGTAPIVYAATATTESQELSQIRGSVWGFLLAGGTSLLAVMGDLATVGLLVWRVGPSTADKSLLVAFLAIASVIVAVYSFRTLLLFVGSDAASKGPTRRSFLGAGATSATL